MPEAAKHAAVRNTVQRNWQQAAPGWRRWESSLAAFLWPVTHHLLMEAQPAPGMRVLDVGSGIGEPALALAMSVGPTGSVLGVDLSENMLATARTRARAYGLNQVRFQRLAAEELPATDPGFDVITSRFGAIFFPDLVSGLKHLRSLLKFGGRLCIATWAAPADNPAFAIPSRALRHVIDAPPPTPDTPGPFRLAEEGAIHEVFEAAGFHEVSVVPVPVYQFAPDVETYWTMLCDMSASFREQLEKLANAERAKVKAEVMAEVSAHEVDGVVRVPALARIGSATRR